MLCCAPISNVCSLHVLVCATRAVPLEWPPKTPPHMAPELLGTTKNPLLSLAATSEARWTEPVFNKWWEGLRDEVTYGRLRGTTDLGDQLVLTGGTALPSASKRIKPAAPNISNMTTTGDGLLVVIAAHCPDEQQWILLMALICGVRRFHGEHATIFIVDNASPPPFEEKISLIAHFDSRILHKKFSTTRWEWGALNETMSWLDNNGAGKFKYVAYFQHSMVLEKPLPLAELACPFVSFQRFGPGWFGTNFVQLCDSWMTKLDNSLVNEPCRVPEYIYFTYSVSFVAHAWAALKLHRLGLWSKIGPLTEKREDQATERLMGIASDHFLHSGPELCNLDGDFQHLPTFVSKYSHEGRVYAKDYYAGLKGGSISKQTWAYKDVNESNMNMCSTNPTAWPAFHGILKATNAIPSEPPQTGSGLSTGNVEPLAAAAAASAAPPSAKVEASSQESTSTKPDRIEPLPTRSSSAQLEGALADLKALQLRLSSAGLDSSLPSEQSTGAGAAATAESS